MFRSRVCSCVEELSKLPENILLVSHAGIGRFAKATITKIEEKKLKDLEESDFEGQEKFESEEKMYEAYKSYYGDKVTPDIIIKMVDFKLE